MISIFVKPRLHGWELIKALNYLGKLACGLVLVIKRWMIIRTALEPEHDLQLFINTQTFASINGHFLERSYLHLANKWI